MPLKTKPFDAADPLTSPKLIDGYLDEAIATGNPAVIRLALSVVASERIRFLRPGKAGNRAPLKAAIRPRTTAPTRLMPPPPAIGPERFRTMG